MTPVCTPFSSLPSHEDSFLSLPMDRSCPQFFCPAIVFNDPRMLFSCLPKPNFFLLPEFNMALQEKSPDPIPDHSYLWICQYLHLSCHFIIAKYPLIILSLCANDILNIHILFCTKSLQFMPSRDPTPFPSPTPWDPQNSVPVLIIHLLFILMIFKSKIHLPRLGVHRQLVTYSFWYTLPNLTPLYLQSCFDLQF